MNGVQNILKKGQSLVIQLVKMQLLFSVLWIILGASLFRSDRGVSHIPAEKNKY